jgi:taurine dioxygenase
MHVVALSDALGAELVDFDITAEHSLEDQAELRRLFKRYHLLLVRGQELTPEDHDRYVSSFGPLQRTRVGDMAGYVTNQDDRRSLFGPELHRLLWHNDGAYGPRPGIGTSLWAVQVTPLAAPTMFANATEIVDRLPAGLRATCEDHRVLNVRDTQFDRTYERVPVKEILETDDPARYVTYEHPVLFQGPHLDRPSIIASEHMTSAMVGLPTEESDAFLQELYAYIYADDNIYAHHWRENDVVIWDNVALHHARPHEVGREPRHLRRQCLDGWYTDDGDVIEWDLTGVKIRMRQAM